MGIADEAIRPALSEGDCPGDGAAESDGRLLVHASSREMEVVHGRAVSDDDAIAPGPEPTDACPASVAERDRRSRSDGCGQSRDPRSWSRRLYRRATAGRERAAHRRVVRVADERVPGVV